MFMQLTPRYLVKNKTNIIANEAGFITEYRSVYTRQIKIFKGIDNVLEFRVLNADQKPVNIQSYTPVIMLFDENQNLVIQHDCTVLDIGTTETKGKCKVTISENDLLNLKQQYLSYSIHLNSSTGNVLTYSDSYFENKGTIYLDGQSLPAPKSAHSITSFSEEVTGTWVSEYVEAQPALNGNEALHTALVYGADFAGDITIQGTLENQIDPGITKWFDIETETMAADETHKMFNFNGVFSYVRVAVDADPANKISKVLIRN